MAQALLGVWTHIELSSVGRALDTGDFQGAAEAFLEYLDRKKAERLEVQA